MHLVDPPDGIEFRPRRFPLVRTDPGPAVTWIWAGELDVADVPALRVAWKQLIGTDPSRVVLDMARVTFIDCGVLSFIVAAKSEARELVLRSVSLPVRRFLHLARSDDLLPTSEPDPQNTGAA